MDDIGGAWIRQSDSEEQRRRLSDALKGWWKLARPFKAWGLYRKLRATTEGSRRRANERLLRKRLADAALANLNEDQRRTVIVQEDRTLTVAGAGTGQTHTMAERPAQLMTMRDLDRIIASPEIMTPGTQVRPLGAREYALRAPGMDEKIRVATDPEYYEEHAESFELWSPGNPVFEPPHASGAPRDECEGSAAGPAR